MFKNAFIKYILIESNHKPELSAALLIQQFSVMYFRPVQTSSWLVLWEQTRLGWGELGGVKKNKPIRPSSNIELIQCKWNNLDKQRQTHA